MIAYDYTAYGVRHRGQRLFGWGRGNPSTYYEVGQPFPVYFVTDKPGDSYGPNPPNANVFFIPGIGFALLGIVVIVSAWRAGPHT